MQTIELVFGTPAHAEILYRIFHGEQMRKHSPVSDLSVEQLRERLSRSGPSFHERAEFYRLFAAVGGEIFGTFVLKNIDWNAKSGEIGFGLLEGRQGRGLATGMARKCMQEIFSRTDLYSLWATTSYDNIAAQRVLVKSGFLCQGDYPEAFIINSISVPQYHYTVNKDDKEGSWNIETARS